MVAVDAPKAPRLAGVAAPPHWRLATRGPLLTGGEGSKSEWAGDSNGGLLSRSLPMNSMES